MQLTKPIRNNKGQMLIEAFLLAIVAGFVSLALIRKLNESKLAPNLVTGPWDKVAGMAESGVWEESGSAKKKHPNNFSRFFTPRPN